MDVPVTVNLSPVGFVCLIWSVPPMKMVGQYCKVTIITLKIGSSRDYGNLSVRCAVFRV